MNLAFFWSIWNFIDCMFCDTVPVCTPYASLRGSEPIVGMDGSRWIWVIGSASFGREGFIGLYSRGRSGRFCGLYYGFF